MIEEAVQRSSSHAEVNSIKRILSACVREHLLPHTMNDNVLFVPFRRSKKVLMANKVRNFTLRKFNIDGDIMIIENHRIAILKDVRSLMNLLYRELDDVIKPEQWQQFIAEIDNCVANDALVSEFTDHYHSSLIQDIQNHHCKSLLDYIASHDTEEQFIFFEQWAATQGHPYHPCHKTKLGFNTNAYQKFSPEFNQNIDIPIAIIEKQLMHLESEQENMDYNAWFAQQFPKQWQALLAKLKAYGLSETAYYPLFIHPWQYENSLINLFPAYIENKQLILFNDICISTKATLSFRTLVVRENQQQPNIKLSIGVQSTSTIRTISPASVENGPRLGKMIRKILQNENHFDHTLRFSGDFCGLHVLHHDRHIAKHLSMIYRDNPCALLNKQQMPIVVAALFKESPLNKLPLFIEIMQSAVGSTLASAKQYFDQYCQIVLKAYFDLYLVYGISLEGHQQNTLAVFENHRPVFMITRDLGAIQIHTPTLDEQGYSFEAYPGSAIVTDDNSLVSNNFLHTVMQYHLGELAILLAKFYEVAENDFWKIVKKNIEDRFQELKDRVAPERWNQAYKTILQDDWHFKGLMSMRLHDVAYDYLYIKINNPLRDA